MFVLKQLVFPLLKVEEKVRSSGCSGFPMSRWTPRAVAAVTEQAPSRIAPFSANVKTQRKDRLDVSYTT